MSGYKIRQLEDRLFVSKVSLMVWSNNIDLLAVSNSKSEISLYRLTWQRVWLLPPSSSDLIVRKIAWRPDGKVLAIAYVSKSIIAEGEMKGKVILVDVESKKILHTTQVLEDISVLDWLEEKQTHKHNKKMSSVFQQGETKDFSNLFHLSSTFASLPSNCQQSIEDSRKIKDNMLFNSLIVGTIDGNLYFYGFGLFSFGIININKYISTIEKGNRTSVLKTEMNSDMTRLFLLVATGKVELFTETDNNKDGERPEISNTLAFKEKSQDTTTQTIPHPLNNKIDELNFEKELNGDGHNTKLNEDVCFEQNPYEEHLCTKGEMKIIVIDAIKLSSRRCELHALSLKYNLLISLSDYLSETMHTVVEAWENIHILEIETKLLQHTQSFPNCSFSAEMLELLLTGVLSEDLENFILHLTDGKSVKKLLYSIETSLLNLQNLIIKHLLPVSESLSCHLAEMKGMVARENQFKDRGLLEQTVSEAWRAVGAFLIKIFEFQSVIDESLKGYTVFFRWLDSVVLRFSDDRIPGDLECSQQDLELIAECLKDLDFKLDKHGNPVKQYFLGRLGQYLIEDDLVSPKKGITESWWQKLMKEKPSLQDCSTILNNKTTNSLLQQHRLVVQAIGNLLNASENAGKDMFQFKSVINIADSLFKRYTMCFVDDNIFLSLIKENIVYMLKVCLCNEEVIKKEIVVKSENSIVMKCLDTKLYIPGTVSVLCEEEQEEGKGTAIAQLDLKSVFNSSDSVTIYRIHDFVASNFAVSGTRKVAAIVSSNKKKIRLLEMEADEDRDEVDGNEPSVEHP